MGRIEGRRVALLAADGFEQSELLVPKQRLEEAGAKVDIISLKTGEIWGWQKGDWGESGQSAECKDDYDFAPECGLTISSCSARCTRHVWRVKLAEDCAATTPLICCHG